MKQITCKLWSIFSYCLKKRCLNIVAWLSGILLRTQRQITQAKTRSPHSLQGVHNWLQCLFLDISHQVQVFLSSAFCTPVTVIFAFPSCVTGPSLGWEHQSEGWPGLTLARAGLVSALPRDQVPGASPAWAWAVLVPPGKGLETVF